MANPHPPPASGQILRAELQQVQTKLDALITAVKAMKQEQERLNSLLTPRERERGG